jgi:hypothetical protein
MKVRDTKRLCNAKRSDRASARRDKEVTTFHSFNGIFDEKSRKFGIAQNHKNTAENTTTEAKLNSTSKFMTPTKLVNKKFRDAFS